MNWQPMASAPFDTLMLVSDGKFIGMAMKCWNELEEEVEFWEFGWADPEDSSHYGCELRSPNLPTYWAPLPERPAA